MSVAQAFRRGCVGKVQLNRAIGAFFWTPVTLLTQATGPQNRPVPLRDGSGLPPESGRNAAPPRMDEMCHNLTKALAHLMVSGVASGLDPPRGADMNLGLAFPYRSGYLRRALALVVITTAWLASPVLSVAQPSSGVPVLVLVRHADKASQPADDPPLTADGVRRAQDLAATLRSAGVNAIITTQLRRTRETAQPVAAALGLNPEVLKVGERALVANPAPGQQFPPEVLRERAEYIKALEAAIRRLSGVVLIVGHDWSVPGLIAALGGPQLPNICSSVYDNLFILISTKGKTDLIQARYGAPTPSPDCK
jgi:phosphohistidine phosphatase SixA